MKLLLGVVPHTRLGANVALLFVLRRTTTSSTLSELCLDGRNARLIVPRDTTWTFNILVSACSSQAASAGYEFRGVIENTGAIPPSWAPP